MVSDDDDSSVSVDGKLESVAAVISDSGDNSAADGKEPL